MSIDIKNFVEDCRSRGLTKQTTATYKSNITTYLNFVGNPLNVDISILCKFLDYLKIMEYKRGKVTKKGVHPNTIKAYFSAISTYYDYLVFNRQLDINPILQFTRRYLSRIKDQYNGENSRQIISIEDMRRLVTLDMPILDRAILMILAKTGIRRGELLAIDREDLNLEKQEIILKPKAKRTNRLVFFDHETALVLRAYLEWKDKRTKSKALFVSSYDCERINRNRVNEIVARHGSTLGLHDPDGNLNTKLTPHCFRHWFTTHLRRSGLPREFIQELRGDRRKDAIDIYDHIDLSELKKRYLECIPKLLEEPEIPKEPELKIKTGRPNHIIQGFTLVLYEYIKRNEGLSIATISKHFLKNKNYVKQYLYNLKDYGLIINDGGNWYPISKEPIAQPHFITINSTGQKAVLIEGIA
jgi:integrase/recombinase XerD